jgi:2-polyprenyl-6-hydroxyphenyl methylase/3-demethylubiquinone-9 3-methyltransferase
MNEMLDQHVDWPPSWRVSQHYDELEIHGSRRDLGYTYLYETRRRIILELIDRVARRGDRILDVAAAQGNFSIALVRAGYEVTWNDIRRELIEFVKLKHSGPGIEFRAGNVFEVDFAKPFDVALVAEVIEHVAHPDEFLGRIAELVRPGGYIVLTTPNGRYFRNPLPRFSACRDFSAFEAIQFGPDAEDHIFLLHPDEIRTLAGSIGLEVVELRTYGTPLTAGFLGTHALLRCLPKKLVRQLEDLSRRMPRSIGERIHFGLTVLLRKP